jgi:cob(I)alamin adenosyltransferase
MTMKIYTKTGDKGTTSLIGGTKVAKSHLRIETYGTVDELNSYIGLVSDLTANEHSKIILKEIQDRLFTIGSALACDPQKEIRMAIPDLHPEDVQLLEKEIDAMNETLPEMRSFILPGGHPTVSHMHIARCVCRRAERAAVLLLQQEQNVEEIILVYLNRLSDYLFILARNEAQLLKVPDIPWKPRLK